MIFPIFSYTFQIWGRDRSFCLTPFYKEFTEKTMSNTIGIYIHIPFCRSKCPYCDFFSMRGNINEYKNYVEILKDKIIYWSKKINKTVDTVYIGGGTPSVLGDELIFEIIKCICIYIFETISLAYRTVYTVSYTHLTLPTICSV